MSDPQPLRWSFLSFDELSSVALYELLALRQEVFVVGQSCLYLDADGLDQRALHLCGHDEEGALCAYLRAFPADTGEGSREAHETWKVGRVLVRAERRGEGLGQALMREVIARLRTRGVAQVKLSAQAYLERFYVSLGFSVCGPAFDDVGIPHLPMRMTLTPPHQLSKVEHVIFDLDGTLIDSSYDYALCFEQLALEWGRPRPSAERVRALMFAGLLPQLEECLGVLSPDELERAIERFRALCVAHPLTHTQLYPGALASLDALEARGVALSVCTNRPRDLAVQTLEALGILERFQLVVGGDDGLERKPSPEMLDYIKAQLGLEPTRLLMVGDSVVDVQAAEASGVPCVAVTWGYTQTADLEAARPTLLLTHPRQLLTHLERSSHGSVTR
jgi:phosphoglycolate phosphatase